MSIQSLDCFNIHGNMGVISLQIIVGAGGDEVGERDCGTEGF